MSVSPRLTLGALYREMRAGLGDAGWARVTVVFRQQTRGDTGAEQGGSEGRILVLEALIDHRDGELDRAELSLVGPEPAWSITVRRDGDGFAYSIDGGQQWGRFSDRPRIFDLPGFEAELDEVIVEDVTFEEVVSPGVDALDVSLDRAAFARLLGIFSADLEEDPETLALSAYSVSLEAAEEVCLDYWWSLGALDGPPIEPFSDSSNGRVVRVTCSVSIRVAASQGRSGAEAVLDQELPEVADIDDVWGLLRRGAPRAATAGPGGLTTS